MSLVRALSVVLVVGAVVSPMTLLAAPPEPSPGPPTPHPSPTPIPLTPTQAAIAKLNASPWRDCKKHLGREAMTIPPASSKVIVDFGPNGEVSNAKLENPSVFSIAPRGPIGYCVLLHLKHTSIDPPGGNGLTVTFPFTL